MALAAFDPGSLAGDFASPKSDRSTSRVRKISLTAARELQAAISIYAETGKPLFVDTERGVVAVLPIAAYQLQSATAGLARNPTELIQLLQHPGPSENATENLSELL